MKSGNADMANETASKSPKKPVAFEERLFALLGEQGQLQLATAESCTGGNVVARLTSLAGSSAYVQGGITTYSNEAKEQLLGVSRAILASVGAVSPECAQAMAEGARKIYGADIAVSTTGIAGPSGATARKPVGLVYIALATGEDTLVEEHRFAGDRAAVTLAATERALQLLLSGVERMLATGSND